MMKKHTSTKKEIAQEFMRGRSCGQCVLGEYADELGYDRDETDRIADCFAGGMLMGQTCGAVTGGLMAIGLACEDSETAHAKAEEYTKRFAGRNGSCLCSELLGCNMGIPEEKARARAEGKLAELCPDLVISAFELLDEILND